MKDTQKLLISIVFIAILAVLVGLGAQKKAFAATTNQTNVTVEVKGVCQITVSPTEITWSSVNPGSVGGIKYLDIKNTGSQNISNVYAYADTLTSEPNNPIPLGTPGSYSSGGVLMLRLNETGASYYYADRLEWNISKPTGAGGSNCTNAIAWGYHRNASSGFADYLWCLTNGTEINSTHGCNSTGTTFYIESDADTGDPSTRQPDISGGSVSEQAGWGIFSGISTGSLAGHCIAVSQDCTKILIYKYDRRTNPNFEACTQDAYLRSETLNTGDQFTINLDAWVPQGIPAGWLASSWLTIEAGTCS